MDIQKKIVSVYFSHALFSILSTHEDLTIQALVWLHKLRSTVTSFGVVWFGTLYVKLRPHIFKHQF